MDTKHKDDLPEKEHSQIRQDRDKFLTRIEKIMKSKDKPEDAVLKELYSAFVERAKARLQRSRETSTNLKRIELAGSDRAETLAAVEKHKKDADVLRSLNSTLEKQAADLQDEYNKTIEQYKEERKEINQKMQEEIKKVQEETEQELQRKQMLTQENEVLVKRIEEMKAMLAATNENVEKALGKSEFDVAKMEEQLKTKIDAETSKIANDEKVKTKKQNKELRKSIAAKTKELAECTKQFEEYKEKIGGINNQVNEYKTELEGKAKLIMDTYEENKVTEEKIIKAKDMILDIKKQMEKSLKEKSVLAILKSSLEGQVKVKEAQATAAPDKELVKPPEGDAAPKPAVEEPAKPVTEQPANSQ